MLLASLIKTLQLMLSLSILVVFHELGHFLAARLFGVRVERFFLFFDWGRAIVKYRSKRSGTLYGIGWLPFGGYCSMAGMVDERFLELDEKSTPQPYEFRAKPAWQRLIIMMGGILFNLILAVVIYSGIALYWGDTTLPSSQVAAGMSFSPAAHKAGFRDNDIILSADGKPLDAFSSSFIRDVITAHEVVVQRKGKVQTIEMPSDMMQQVMAEGVGFMGIQIPFIVDSVLPNTAASKAGMRSGDVLLSVDSLPIVDATDAQILFREQREKTHVLGLLRAGDTLTATLRPDTAGRIGVQLLADINKIYPTEKVQYSLLQSIPAGCSRAVSTLKGYVGNMKYVFTKEGAQQMGGFISIGKLFDDLFDSYRFWSITALLSVILAFMNFLPIPMLDGGYILFTLWEIITRRKVSDKTILKANKIGFILLLALLLYANGNDFLRTLLHF